MRWLTLLLFFSIQWIRRVVLSASWYLSTLDPALHGMAGPRAWPAGRQLLRHGLDVADHRRVGLRRGELPGAGVSVGPEAQSQERLAARWPQGRRARFVVEPQLPPHLSERVRGQNCAAMGHRSRGTRDHPERVYRQSTVLAMAQIGGIHLINRYATFYVNGCFVWFTLVL